MKDLECFLEQFWPVFINYFIYLFIIVFIYFYQYCSTKGGCIYFFFFGTILTSFYSLLYIWMYCFIYLMFYLFISIVQPMEDVFGSSFDNLFYLFIYCIVCIVCIICLFVCHSLICFIYLSVLPNQWKMCFWEQFWPAEVCLKIFIYNFLFITFYFELNLFWNTVVKCFKLCFIP